MSLFEAQQCIENGCDVPVDAAEAMLRALDSAESEIELLRSTIDALQSTITAQSLEICRLNMEARQ